MSAAEKQQTTFSSALKIKHVRVGGCCYAEQDKQSHHTPTCCVSNKRSDGSNEKKKQNIAGSFVRYVTVCHQGAAEQRSERNTEEQFIPWKTLDNRIKVIASCCILSIFAEVAGYKRSVFFFKSRSYYPDKIAYFNLHMEAMRL